MQNGATNGEGVLIAAEKWSIIKPRGEYYTADKIIDAYLAGGEEGLGLTQQALVSFLVKNVDKTVSYRCDVYQYLRRSGFHPQRAFLKINTWDSFDVLVTIPEEEFLDPKFLPMYVYAGGIEGSARRQLFHIYFSFIEESEELDEKQMYSDGFVLKYSERQSVPAGKAA